MRKQLFFVLLLITALSYGQEASLFKIVENGKIGYINNKGETIIKPIYYNGNDFSEGLACVRTGGYFGFINDKGEFVIPAVYDFAESFINGLAHVYKDGKSIYINKKNKQIIGKPYTSLLVINNKRGIIKTSSNRYGIADLKTGKLLVDTLYSRINMPYKGVYVVQKYTAEKKVRSDNSMGVIDSVGHYIVPIGKYSWIRDFQSDYTVVNMGNYNTKQDTNIYQGAIDLKGKLQFKRPRKGYDNYIEGNFKNGFAKVQLYKDWLPKKENEDTYLKQYAGYINIKGEVVLNDTLNKFASDFTNERAYVVGFDRKINLINTKFERVNKEPLDYIVSKLDKGYLKVSVNGKTGIIDKDANYIIKPTFKNIHEFGYDKDVYFFSNDSIFGNKLYGMANHNSEVILEPIISDFDNKGFVNGLLSCTIKGKLTYINKKGEIIWQEKESKDNLPEKMNIDFMNHPSYYAIAFDPSNSKNSDYWDYYTYPKTITKGFEKGKLSVLIDTIEPALYRAKHLGHKIYVSNATDKPIEFNTIDSNISMRLQAKDKNGQWKYIEYIGSVMCGNSFYKVNLGANKYWDFVMPDYDGEFKTIIRAELKYINPETHTEEAVYSNEIGCGINPAQFWNNYEFRMDLY